MKTFSALAHSPRRASVTPYSQRVASESGAVPALAREPSDATPRTINNAGHQRAGRSPRGNMLVLPVEHELQLLDPLRAHAPADNSYLGTRRHRGRLAWATLRGGRLGDAILGGLEQPPHLLGGHLS